MRLEVLGSGGAVTTPKPFCNCSVCTAARTSNDPKYSRYGPSVFIHGPDVLIDTPEEIRVQLNRSAIKGVSAVLYSHWHPDHTMGRRFLERNIDWVGLPPKHEKTQVIVPKTIAATFESRMAIMAHFEHYMKRGIVDFIVVDDTGSFEVNGYQITPVQLAIGYVFGYEIASRDQRALIIMDELKGWIPSDSVSERAYDLVYLPIGVLDVNPISGERLVSAGHPMLKGEQSISETMDVMRAIDSRRFVLSHVEEPDAISIELGEQLSEYCSSEIGAPVTVAFDTMMIRV